MIVAVMQPYFFPYIGYWQLINAVDCYVIFDDVNYINRGWINRNRIEINGKVNYINLPLHHASQNKKINETLVDKDRIQLTIRKIQEGYRKAPYYDEIFPFIEEIMVNANTENAAMYNYCIIKSICEYLGINTKIMFSSQIKKEEGLKGEKKILFICKKLMATEYINAIGGMSLYKKEAFEQEGVQLSFIKTDEIFYSHENMMIRADLSIIDVLMYNTKENVKRMLDQYVIINS